MSTILNALKRLEDESRTEAGKQIPMSMSGRATASGSKPRLRRVLVWVGLTILVGTAVFWGYRDRSSSEGPASLATAPPQPPVETATGENTRMAPPSAPVPDGRPAEEVRTHQANRDRRPPQPITGVAVNPKTVLTAPNYVPPDPEGINSPARSPQPLPQQADTATAAPRPAAPPSTQKDPYALAEALPKDALQLQAISWSDLPGDRITIITGQILREGQTIDGYTVIEIRPDDVIVEKAGKRWKLIYGSR